MTMRTDSSLASSPDPAGADVAVVGMACRFPGGDGIEEYWESLREGRCEIGPLPAQWWRDHKAPDDGSPGPGGYLRDFGRFDADFFDISAAEAERMDPQQRLLLEVTWHALEDAGVNVENLAGSRTGVYVGVHSQSSDYFWMQADDINTYTGTGTSHGMLAGRLAYLLDLRGPAMVIDTACSSALVAVHLAMRSLREGECDIAIVGGVHALLAGTMRTVGRRMNMLSKTGQCRPFDAAADGIISGEGGGTVVLKRLADALRDRDRVLGVLLGSAVGQDGRSNGLTAPNPLAQRDVVRQAMRDANVFPEQVSYVEAHGTGTPLGDPIELEALGDVFGPAPVPTLGSVKANLGHLEGAAGIASLIKVLLMLQHRTIPRQPQFERPNPRVDVPGYPSCVPMATRTWQAETTRIAGISSFGWSGTNAHLLVSEAVDPQAQDPSLPQQGILGTELEILTVSARSESVMRELAGAYADALSSGEAVSDICYTANTGRRHLPYRTAVVAPPEALKDRLVAIAAGEPAVGVHSGKAEPRLRVAFLFSGNVEEFTTFTGRASELFATVPIFEETVRRCDDIAGRWLTPKAVEACVTGIAPEDWTRDLDLARTVTVTLQIALATMWRAWGIEPAAVAGSGIGELAAAYVAGHLGMERCLRLAAAGNVVPETESSSAAPRPSRLPVFSLATGNPLSHTDHAVPEGHHRRGLSLTPAGFTRSLAELRRRGCKVLLELGPDTFADLRKASVPDPSSVWVVSHDAAGPAPHLTALAQLYAAGLNPRWPKIYPPFIRRKAHLPGYPFHGRVHWLTPVTAVPAVEVPEVQPTAYEIRWRPAPKAPESGSGTPGPNGRRLVLLVGASELGTPLAERLRAQGISVIRVLPGRGFERRDAYTYTVDGTGTHIVDVLRETTEAEPTLDVVHLWPDGDGASNPSTRAEEAVGVVLNSLRAHTGRATAHRLHLVTVGSQMVDGDTVHPAGAIWWGIGRTAMIEYPQWAVRLIDMADPGDTVELDALVTEIIEPDRENQLALRGGRRFAARLVAPSTVPPAGPPALDSDGCYLVTGGLGGLGLETAEWLVSLGARHLVLTGRSKPSEEARARLAALTARGVSVETVFADVGDPSAMRDLFARWTGPDGRGPVLRGVVHSAGIHRDRPIAKQAWQDFEEVFRAKVDGALLLHEHTRHTDLDFFVIYSSAAAVLGSAGQANYAAANAYADALTHHRRAQGLPATTVNWGLWAEIGMGARLDAQSQTRWHAMGVHPMSPADSLRKLGQVLAAGQSQAVVLAADWVEYQAAHRGRIALPLLTELLPAAKESAGSPAPAPVAERNWRAMPTEQRRRELAEFIGTELAELLSEHDLGVIPPDRSFTELDVDSLTSIELGSRLADAVGLPLPAEAVFEHDTCAELAAYLDDELNSAAPIPPESRERTPQAASAPGLLDTFWSGIDNGRYDDAHALMYYAARLRPDSGTTQAMFDTEVTRLAGNGEGIHLWLLQPLVALNGPRLYRRFASALGDGLTVSALALPGFLSGELLAADPAALFRSYQRAIASVSGEGPFVLAAHSSGGALAWGLAAHLEQHSGQRPNGIVLIDSHAPDSSLIQESGREFYQHLRQREGTVQQFTVERLTAQAWYLNMFGDWTSRPPICPSLLVRASEPLRPSAGSNWQPTLPGVTEILDTPGNHFTMMEDHVATTARLVRAWIDQLNSR